MRLQALLAAVALLAGCAGVPADDALPPAADDPSPGAGDWAPVEAEGNGGFRLGQATPCARTPTDVDPLCSTFTAWLIVPDGHRGLDVRLNVTDGSFVELLADGPAACDVGGSSGTGDGPWTFTAACPELGPGEHAFEVNMLQGDANGRLEGTTLAEA